MHVLIYLRFVVQLHKKRGPPPPRPQVSSYVITDGKSANHKSYIGQREREQWDITPSSKRLELFKASLDLLDSLTNAALCLKSRCPPCSLVGPDSSTWGLSGGHNLHPLDPLPADPSVNQGENQCRGRSPPLLWIFVLTPL